jgi:hypothetical protein
MNSSTRSFFMNSHFMIQIGLFCIAFLSSAKCSFWPALRTANNPKRKTSTCFQEPPGLVHGAQSAKSTIPTINNAQNRTTVDSLRPLFKSIDFKGDFCVAANLGMLPVGGVSVNGVGVIAVPYGANTAAAMKSVAIQAPYGLGSQTIVDQKVRDCFQIDAHHITTNSKWDEAVRNLVDRAAEGLGLNSSQVTSKLYKLLMYEEGGHFDPHRDTEKVEGMFATLIIQFPSDFAGGSVVVRHGGIERAFDMGAKDGTQQQDFHFLAMYADCEHELRQITAGNRLVAVYSLRWACNSAPPAPPNMNVALDLAAAFEHFHGQGGLLLEHQYTMSSLARYGLRALKGNDRAIAGALQAAGALLGEGNLELSIARATRVVMDHPDSNPWEEKRYPQLQVLSTRRGRNVSDQNKG